MHFVDLEINEQNQSGQREENIVVSLLSYYFLVSLGSNVTAAMDEGVLNSLERMLRVQ